VDTRSDIYSLGLVAYEMLAGALPYPKGQDAMLARLIAPPVRLALLRPDIRWSESLQQALDRALAVAPADRYQSIDELRRDLARALEEMVPAGGVERRSRPRGRLPRGRAPALLAGLGAVAVTALLVVYFATRGPASTAGAQPAAVAATQPRAGSSPPPVRAADSTRLLPRQGAGDRRASAVGAGARRSAGADSIRQSRAVAAELARVGEMVASQDDAQARSALEAIRVLMPRLTSAADSAEADYAAVSAHLWLGEKAEACGALRRLVAARQRRPDIESGMEAFLADSSLRCR
jgi:hypothetical protein